MRCPKCTSPNVGQIGFAFQSGLHFQYCRRCEHRWWESATSRLPLADVLQAATTLARAS